MFMHPWVKTGIIIAIILVVIIGVFWFLLPLFGVPEMVGDSYWMVSLGGSLAISLGLGFVIRKIWKD